MYLLDTSTPVWSTHSKADYQVTSSIDNSCQMSLNGLLNGGDASTSGPAGQAAQEGTLPKAAPVSPLESDGLPSMPPAGVEAAAGPSVDAPMPLPAQEALNIHQSQVPQGSLYSDAAPQLNGGIAGHPGIVPDTLQDQDPVQPIQQESLPEPSMSADVDQPLPETTVADQSMEEATAQPVQHEPIPSAISAPAPAPAEPFMPSAPESIPSSFTVGHNTSFLVALILCVL